MKIQLMRYVISAAMLSSLAFGLVGVPALVSAAEPALDPSKFKVNKPQQYFGALETEDVSNIVPGVYKDPKDLARNIINIILGFLGIIAVIIILMAGFQWMTAGGEEEKVTEARQRLIQGAIGLILIIAAWIIAYFVIDALVKAIQGPVSQ